MRDGIFVKPLGQKTGYALSDNYDFLLDLLFAPKGDFYAYVSSRNPEVAMRFSVWLNGARGADTFDKGVFPRLTDYLAAKQTRGCGRKVT